ncbi:hypothetical protein SAMN05216337_103849 [Bradyrhizobium brasilense]|uniref:Immunity MXAN-0049 protein domain-containing protein n=1 Tax=Bradyrhizobium brasilense TaxID=1419277 RepID=A0A1G7GM85_9BRAD|nr:hypothetical protein SAMN05216337_103849 [Bradyrhizobium brasilense]
MVWGWYERSQFGDFFPNGDYVGWEEGLKQYFDEQMSAEQRAALNDWHVAYIGEVARKFREDRGLLEPRERPLEFRMEESRKSLGSLLHLTNGVRAVDATLHAIIEKLEPGVHQFWPLRITTPKGKDYPVPYYGIIVRRYIDSFVPEQSAVHQVSEGSTAYFANNPTKKGYGSLTVLKRVSVGAHLWHERRLLNPSLFFSDELQAAMTQWGLRVPTHHRLNAI